MKKIFGVLIYLSLILFTTALYGCEKKDIGTAANNEKLIKVTLPKEKDQFINLDLYFESAKDDKKAEVIKEERLVKKEELIGELIVQELIKGPSAKSSLLPVLPKDTRLLSFSIKDNIAYVNLSREAKVAMTSTREEAALKSIAASLSQLSSISKIKITIENKDADTLGGNYDISKPFGKDDIDGRKK